MPFVTTTKRSKEIGFQTYARARLLPPEIQEAELEYLSVRDWYLNERSRLAQFQEFLAQCDEKDRKEIGNKIHGIESVLADARQRQFRMAESSYGEAIAFVAERMLPKEVWMAIEKETERLLGRPRLEIKLHAGGHKRG